MKRFHLLIAMLFSCQLLPFCGYAQERLVVCGTWYDYDAAGNRIKRYYDCKNISGTPDIQNGLLKSLPRDSAVTPVRDNADNNNVIVFPNPTTGAFHIRLTGAETPAHFHIYDTKGAIIISGQISNNLYKGCLAHMAAGSYLVIVYRGYKAYQILVRKE